MTTLRKIHSSLRQNFEIHRFLAEDTFLVKYSEMDDERLQLAKRHSFPYMKVCTWNILKSGSANEVEIEIPKADSVPVIDSEGTSEEREARLEAAILWIRKELVGKKKMSKDTENCVGNIFSLADFGTSSKKLLRHVFEITKYSRTKRLFS